MAFTRYAIYYIPPRHSALAAFGAGWLGYDIETGATVAQPLMDGIDLAEITAEPRRYGFHATLKAPFALADGAGEADLLGAATQFAARTPPAAGPALHLAAIAGFLALLPADDAVSVADLAADCVRAFDKLRRPPEAAEIARREPAKLSPQQRAYLERWGYPYVFAEFRFHMTLTRRLAASERALIEPALAARTAALLGAPLAIGDIALCRQEPGGAFTLWRRLSLSGA